MGLTMAKELIADTLEEKDIKIGGKNIGELLNSPEYQKNIEKTITKMIKILILEFFEKGMDFKEKTKSIRKERKVGRPKSQRKVGRPKQGLD
jgi:negative regulator of replication initiation